MGGRRASGRAICLDLGCLTKPHVYETVDCQRNLRSLRGGPRYGCDVDDEYAHALAAFDFAAVDGGFAAFLFVHAARRRPCRMVDRKKLLCLINLWLVAAAAGLAANFVFAANPACFLAVILAVLQWKRTTAEKQLTSNHDALCGYSNIGNDN